MLVKIVSRDTRPSLEMGNELLLNWNQSLSDHAVVILHSSEEVNIILQVMG